MIRVAKRDNSIVDFNLDKIKGAISQAFDATNKVYDDQIIELIALRSTANFNSKIKDGVIHVEDIQDGVEIALIQSGYVDVAKAYITYRKQHENIRQMGLYSYWNDTKHNRSFNI